MPVPGPGHPLAAAVPRGLRHARAVQGVPGDQRGPGPRDGRPRHAGRGPGQGADRRSAADTTPVPSAPSAKPEPGVVPVPVPAAPEGPDPTPSLRDAGRPRRRPRDRDETVEPDLATLNARLGLLASLAGFAFALPAVAILKLGRRGQPCCGRASPCSPPPRWPAPACRCPGGWPAGRARRGGRVGSTGSGVRADAGRRHRDGPGRRPRLGRRRGGPGRLPAHRRHRGHPRPHARCRC